ncbi:transcription initiation factor TFIID subunit 9 [Trichonephila clavipes]|nr:transcription initiation factor TFIID subunit 9 [Trichonephila clavipes]
MESGENIPKDAQVVAEILKELGIEEYEDRVLDHMLEFTNKYVSSVILDAQVISNHSNKETIDSTDVALAISHQQNKIFTSTPGKELTASMAKHKNSIPLPQIKSGAVSRLPPDRYSLTACNYRMKSRKKRTRTVSRPSGVPTNSENTTSQDHARFNDETDNENHNDEIINGESIPIYSFIVLKIFIYDGLARGNCCYCEHIKAAPASTVQLLHKIVNDEPYSKSSRKELKKFAGFPQNYDIEARKDKILKDFTKTELITVCTILGLNCAGSAKELSKHIFKNLSDLASLKNNFTEQLTDDEDSAPFSLESTNDANKQPLTPPIYHLPSPQDVFVPLPQTQRNQSQRGNEENVFLLKDLFFNYEVVYGK